MSTSPAAADPRERDVVFVSYSRADEEWMQTFRTMLQPALASMDLQLWTDSDIRTGEEWDAEIDRAVARSRAALLLVSQHFLASPYIRERELPALISRRVPLAPILVGACLHTTVRELAAVQWLHDPLRDGALNAIEHAGKREAQVARACTRLLATVIADPGYIARQIGRVGVHTCETDLGTFADDPAVGWWRRWIPRHAGVLTPPDAGTASTDEVAQTLQFWLSAEDANGDPRDVSAVSGTTTSTPSPGHRTAAGWPSRPGVRGRAARSGSGTPGAGGSPCSRPTRATVSGTSPGARTASTWPPPLRGSNRSSTTWQRVATRMSC